MKSLLTNSNRYSYTYMGEHVPIVKVTFELFQTRLLLHWHFNVYFHEESVMIAEGNTSNVIVIAAQTRFRLRYGRPLDSITAKGNSKPDSTPRSCSFSREKKVIPSLGRVYFASSPEDDQPIWTYLLCCLHRRCYQENCVTPQVFCAPRLAKKSFCERSGLSVGKP